MRRRMTFCAAASGVGVELPMKRIIVITLVCIIALAPVMALAGCGDKAPPNFVNSPEDVQGKNIGVLNGSPSARLADELGSAWGFNSSSEMISALMVGSLDCVIMESTNAAQLVSDMAGIRTLGEPLLEYELRFAVAKENAELRREINAALSALSSNGVLDGLRDRYFGGKPYAYTPPENVTPHPGMLMLAISHDDKPFSYIDTNGYYAGLNIQVAIAVCDYLGVELQITEFETGELITAVWYGKADFALGWLPGDVQDKVNLSDPYADSSHVIIVRK